MDPTEYTEKFNKPISMLTRKQFKRLNHKNCTVDFRGVCDAAYMSTELTPWTKEELTICEKELLLWSAKRYLR